MPGEPLHSVGTLRTCEGPSEIHRPSGKGLGMWTLPMGTAVGPCSHCLCSDTQEAGNGLAMASQVVSLGQISCIEHEPKASINDSVNVSLSLVPRGTVGTPDKE